MTAEALLSMCANLRESCRFSKQREKTTKTMQNQDYDTRPVANSKTHSPAIVQRVLTMIFESSIQQCYTFATRRNYTYASV